MEKRRLTADEWAQARRRWEGAVEEGFDWLRKEIAGAFDADVSRQAVADQAKRKGWGKGGSPSAPLAGKKQLAQDSRHLAQEPKNLAQEKRKLTPSREARQPADDGVTDIGEDGRPLVDGSTGTAPKPWVRKPNPVGKPTKYRPEFAEELLAYFSAEPFETVVTNPETGRTVQVPAKFPMFESFAASIGVTYEALRSWAAAVGEDGNLRYPEFAAAYARARQLQHANLVQGTMAGAYEPRFASLAAKNMIGWKDKIEVEADQTAISRDVLEANFATEMAAAHERMSVVLAQRLALERGGEIED